MHASQLFLPPGRTILQKSNPEFRKENRSLEWGLNPFEVEISSNGPALLNVEAHLHDREAEHPRRAFDRHRERSLLALVGPVL